MNLAGTAAMAVLVLYARDELGLSNTQYGLLLTVEAAGAVLGSAAAARLSARFGTGTTIIAAILVAGLSMLAAGIWAQPVVLAASLALGGFAGLVWNVLTVSLRQWLVPDELLGRVNSGYRLIGWGTVPVGAVVGGIVAQVFGLRAPFLFAGTAALLLAVSVWPRITNRGSARPALGPALINRGRGNSRSEPDLRGPRSPRPGQERRQSHRAA